MKNLAVQFHYKQHCSVYNIGCELKQAAKHTLFMLKTKTAFVYAIYGAYMFTQLNRSAALNVDSKQLYPAAFSNKDQP